MFKIIQVPNTKGDKVYFGHALVGEFFTFNGNVYKKQSSRTAKVQNYPSERAFYFSSNELITIC